jgi:glycosyltransferase involved in cell wall biosynthesis
MKDLLTIVIPCKNEKFNIAKCLGSIYEQFNIKGTRVIIPDSSDEKSIEILNDCKLLYKDKLNIEIIEGGFPSKARLLGSKLVETKYVLFIDADMVINDYSLLPCLIEMMEIKRYEFYRDSHIDKTYHLVSATFTTDKKWNWAYRVFDFLQYISFFFFKTPFAIGGFQLWRTDIYWKCGGYVEDELFAEDYSISSKVNPNHFYVHKTNNLYTSPRRFENKGIWYMAKIMFKAYLNRNNPEFFKNAHGYWD